MSHIIFAYFTEKYMFYHSGKIIERFYKSIRVVNQFSSSNPWSVYKRVWKEFFQEFFFSRSYEIESKKSQTQVKRCNTVIWNAFFLLILAQEKE